MAQRIRRGAREMVDEALKEVETVSAAEAKALHGRDDVVFVDIRDVRELQRDGRVPEAVHAPRGMLEFWVDPESPYHKDVFASGKKFVLYCASGWRSALATDRLKEMGLDNVAHIEGGFTAWKEAGGPVSERSKKKA